MATVTPAARWDVCLEIRSLCGARHLRASQLPIGPCTIERSVAPWGKHILLQDVHRMVKSPTNPKCLWRTVFY